MRHFSCFADENDPSAWAGSPDEKPRPIGILQLGETVTVQTSLNRDFRPGVHVETMPPLRPGHRPSVFLIDGVKAGDWIAIHLDDIHVGRYGYVRRGGPFLNRPRIVLEASDGKVNLPGGVAVPLRPMAGVIGVMPATPQTAGAGIWGGNMDNPDVKPGSTFHVRAQRDGGYFTIGDIHGIQGDGEICVSGFEIDAVTTLRVDRSPGFSCQGPVNETADELQTLGIYDDWANAVRLAFWEMVELVRGRFGLSDEDANVLVGLVGHPRCCGIYGIGGLSLGIGPQPAIMRMTLTKEATRRT